MSVTINAKGTSVSSFKVGKNGTIIDQAGIISPPSGVDLTINLDADKNLVVDAGISGPALITTSSNQDLHINPAVGGGQHLILNSMRWPTTAGAAGQTLVSNGSGILSWEDAPGVGTVLSVSVALANGFAGSVSSATSNPEITISTSVSGLLKSSAGALTPADSTDITSLISGIYVLKTGDTMTGALTAPAFNTSSTSRIKDAIVDIGQSYLDRFNLLKPREYNRTDIQIHEFGFIAEEMVQVYPEIVGKDAAGQPTGIDYSKLSTILTAKIQEQEITINEMKDKLSAIMALLNMML